MIKELTLCVSDRPDAFDAILGELAAQSCNVLAAMWLGGIFSDFGVACIVPDDAAVATRIFREAGIRYQIREVFAVAMLDEPGRLAQLTRILASNDIPLRRLYHTEYRNDDGLALTILVVDDNARCANVLDEEGIASISVLPPQR